MKGLEESLNEDPYGPKSSHFPLKAVQEHDLGKLILLSVSITPVEGGKAMLNLCSVPAKKDPVEEGKRFIMLSMLLRKCSPNIAVFDGIKESPLSAAIGAKNHRFIKLLLDHGADVTARDGELRTPLHAAAREGDLKALQLLLDNSGTRFSGMKKMDDVFPWFC